MRYRQNEIGNAIQRNLIEVMKAPWRDATSGGWKRARTGSAEIVADTWSTAEMVILLHYLQNIGYSIPALQNITIEKLFEKAEGFIAGAQKADGGWSHEGPSNASGTALAIWALSIQTGASPIRAKELRKQIHDGIGWLVNNQSPNDYGWCLDGPDAPSTTYDTCVVCLASDKLQSSFKHDPNVSVRLKQRSLEFLFDSQNPTDGGWGNRKGEPSNPRDTAYATYTLFDVFHDEHIDERARRGHKWLREYRRRYGHWNDVESTSWVIKAYLQQNVIPDDSHLRDAIDFILDSVNDDRGWGSVKGDDSTTFHTFYALYALSHYWLVSTSDRKQKSERGRRKLLAAIRETLANDAFWGFTLVLIFVISAVTLSVSIELIEPF